MTIVLVFDTETTGLPRYEMIDGHQKQVMPYIVQLSWLLYDTFDNKILSTHDHIIRLPKGVTMSRDVIQFHNITNEHMLTHGEHITDVLVQFVSHMKQSDYIVAHNFAFDQQMIQTEFMRNGMIDYFDVMKGNQIWYCTMKESTELCNIRVPDIINGGTRVKYPKLEELHAYLFGKNQLRNLHNAFNDVLVCFRCFYKMIYDRDIIRMNRSLRDGFYDTFDIQSVAY